MRLFRRETSAGGVAAALALAPGESVLAEGIESDTARVVVTTYRLVRLLHVEDQWTVDLSRPWHEVDTGAWEPQTGTVTVSWVAGGRASQWTFGPQGSDRFASAFRDRVTASVMLAETVELDGRTIGQATIRRDLRTAELTPLMSFARGVRRTDDAARRAADQVLDSLKEQVGL